MNAFQWIPGLALVSALAAGTASAAEAQNPLADSVRTANDRFKDVSVALKATRRSPAPAG
jgi:hypothetical protein